MGLWNLVILGSDQSFLVLDNLLQILLFRCLLVSYVKNIDRHLALYQIQKLIFLMHIHY
jgi:hypothetical protein